MWQLLGRSAPPRAIEDGGTRDPSGTKEGADDLRFFCKIYPFHDWATANDFPITSIAPEEKGTVRTALFPVIPEYEITLPPLDAIECKDVLLAGRRMAAFTADGNGRGNLLNNYLGLYGEAQNIGHFEFFAEIFENMSSATVCLSRPTRRLEGPHLLFSQIPNYYHWLVDALPLVEYVGRLGPSTRLVLPPGLRIQEESLRLMGIASDRLEYVSPDENVVADQLHIFSDRGVSAVGNSVMFSSRASWRVATTFPTLEGRNYVRDTIRKALDIGAEEHGSELVYSVRDDPARTLTNEAELRSALTALGFRTVNASQLSFGEQVSAFSKARLIVGQHGANMANILFSYPGTRVVEIFVPGQWMLHNCYLEICRGNDMSYSRYLATESNVISVDDFKDFIRGLIT
jgi:hypothetical protein